MTPEEMTTEDTLVAERTAALEAQMFDNMMQADYDLPELAETYEEATARMVANRYLAALAGILNDVNVNEASFKAEVAFLRQRLEEKNAALDRRAGWLREQLERLTKFFTFPPKAKSLTLPYGRVGFRKTRDSVEYVDDARAFSWVKTFLPDAVTVETVEKLNRARVNALLLDEQSASEPHVRALLDSGVVRVYRGRDEFYVSPTHGDTEKGRETA